jgi:hypothetical protein
MSDRSNTRLISAYLEQAPAPMFLSGFFKYAARGTSTRPRRSKSTSFATARTSRSSSTDLTAGARENEATAYVNKALHAPDLRRGRHDHGVRRDPPPSPGRTRSRARTSAFERGRNRRSAIFQQVGERKIRRSIELMASQVLADRRAHAESTRTASMRCTRSISSAKSTHKVTAGTVDWATDGSHGRRRSRTSSEPWRRWFASDGKIVPNMLIFGKSAWQRFIRERDGEGHCMLSNKFNSQNLGAAHAGDCAAQGATFDGLRSWIGMYRFEMWTYDGLLQAPADGRDDAVRQLTTT